MTTATLATGNRTMATVEKPRLSLEELVDRLMAALFKAQPETAPATETPSVAKSVHEARRLRQAGDVDGALAVLAGMDVGKAEKHKARWAFSEWSQLVKRRFGDLDAMVYSQGTGRAAALVPTGDGVLEGRGGPGDALAPRQAGLWAQPAWAEALGEGLPSALTGEWPGAVVAQATADKPALNARRAACAAAEASGYCSCPFPGLSGTRGGSTLCLDPGSSPSCDCLNGRSVPPGSTPHGGRCLPRPLPCGLPSLFPQPHTRRTGPAPDSGRGQDLCPDARRSLPRT